MTATSRTTRAIATAPIHPAARPALLVGVVVVTISFQVGGGGEETPRPRTSVSGVRLCGLGRLVESGRDAGGDSSDEEKRPDDRNDPSPSCLSEGFHEEAGEDAGDQHCYQDSDPSTDDGSPVCSELLEEVRTAGSVCSCSRGAYAQLGEPGVLGCSLFGECRRDLVDLADLLAQLGDLLVAVGRGLARTDHTRVERIDVDVFRGRGHLDHLQSFLCLAGKNPFIVLLIGEVPQPHLEQRVNLPYGRAGALLSNKKRGS